MTKAKWEYTGKKKTFTYLVVDGVKLGEHNSVDEARLVRHGVVRQGLIELYLRTRGNES